MFSSDHTFTLKTVHRSTGPELMTYLAKGRWHVVNDSISFDVEISSHPGIPVGTRDWNRILQVSEFEIITESKNGKVTVARRLTQGSR